MPQEQNKPHTYRLKLDMPVPSFDGQTTRGTTEWEDGSQVEFKFYTKSRTDDMGHIYNSVSGIATYNAADKEWLFNPEVDFPSDRTMTDCEVRYYQSQADYDEELMTAVYYGTANYSLDGNQLECSSISLKPINWRLRFQGGKDVVIKLTSWDVIHNIGKSLYLDDRTQEFLGWNTEISLKVADNGYTPYIYGTFKNETGDNTITIETGGRKYTRTISGTALKPGETGYIVIPTESNYKAEGWKVAIEAVDLRLPSGLLWANMNVGASKPEDYGDYFAWGETEPKSEYNWDTYKWCNGSYTTLTKYCTSSEYGTVDNKTVLEAADDAAAANWGGKWRMPTTEEQQELIDKCTWTWTTQNGIYGYKVTGKNNNSIFLPAAGNRDGVSLSNAGTRGYYWSLNCYHYRAVAYNLRIYFAGYDFNPFDRGYYRDDASRYFGQSVRPVQEPETKPTPVTDCTFTVTGNGKDVTFKMILVEHGTFQMGSEDSEAYDDEEPVHPVELTKDYYIGQTEVTQALWYAVMGQKPTTGIQWNSTYGVGDNRPAYYVSWNDCQEFITKLNEMAKSQLDGRTFRLPTEAEWEFAARGGNLGNMGYKYSGSNTIGDVAWYRVNSSDKGSSSPDYGTHDVATKAPNELGIYDMSGNVWEYCSDWYDDSYHYSSLVIDPTGPNTGSIKVYRGGGWSYDARNCRVSYRYSWVVGRRDFLGFRLALQ